MPEQPVPRQDLCAEPRGGRVGAIAASLCHVTDLHVLDAASPARFEWIQTLAADPRWQPLLHMHRPYETLVPHAVAAHVDNVNRDPGGATGTRQLDLVVSTGDNIDNAQANELTAYLALMSGGSVSFDVHASVQRADADHATRPWPYWAPDGDVEDVWKQRGYPVVDGFWAQLDEPLVTRGWRTPWTALPGNHDLMCQGTAWATERIAAVSTGATKAIRVPSGFEPENAASLFVDHPELFLGIGHRSIAPDPSRRSIDLAEWIAAHAAAGAVGWGSGQRAPNAADTEFEVGEITLAMVDTNHPAGDYQGSVGRAQLEWLDDVLARADRERRLVIVASHHGSATLVNDRGDDAERLLSDAMLDVLGRHASCIAWLTGHRHLNEIKPHRSVSGGFWEITTSSLIDWPVERRLIDVVQHEGGVVEIATRVARADAAPNSLAALHQSLAERFAGRRAPSMAGAPSDRDARLFLAR